MSLGGRNPRAWNHWYHCVGSTYGTWLRGDPRGFRTFRYREHVDGDYRRPPPDIYRPMLERSRERLKHPPIVLGNDQRRAVAEAMVERFARDEVQVVSLAVASNHFHVLARFPALRAEDAATRKHTILRDGRDPAPRHYLVLARKHASHVLRARGLKAAGEPVWAGRPKCEPIRDRGHQLNTTRYIREHVAQGAAVWCLGEWVRA
ncbi:MAG: hypothetical protein AAGE65_10060 [Planctomycetota bacterium]